MFVDDVNNARRHSERNNSKDNGEGLAGPTDGLIQRPLLIQEARIIGHLLRDSWIRGYLDSQTIYFGRTVGL